MLLTSKDLLSNEPRILNNSSQWVQTSTEDHLKDNSKFHNNNSKALPNNAMWAALPTTRPGLFLKISNKATSVESQRTPIWVPIFTQIIRLLHLSNNRQNNKLITAALAHLLPMQVAKAGLCWASRTPPKSSKGRIAIRIKQLKLEQAMSEKVTLPEMDKFISKLFSQARPTQLWSPPLSANRQAVAKIFQMLYWDVPLVEHKVDKLQLAPWAITNHLLAISLPLLQPMRVAVKEVARLTQPLKKEEAWASIPKVQLANHAAYQRTLHSMSWLQIAKKELEMSTMQSIHQPSSSTLGHSQRTRASQMQWKCATPTPLALWTPRKRLLWRWYRRKASTQAAKPPNTWVNNQE